MRTARHMACAIVIALVAGQGLVSAQSVGTAFTFQGRLTDGGNPANGQYDLKFEVYDDATAGTKQGDTVLIEDQQVTKGLFTVNIDVNADVFTGNALWLEISVRPGVSVDPYTLLSPRQELKPVPYALALPGLWTQQTAGGIPNLIGGHNDNSVTTGVVGATISGGGANAASNLVTDHQSTVGGGERNQAGDNASTTANARWATVGGGSSNTASGLSATVAGGSNNTASADNAAVAGGYDNSAEGLRATIGGGANNTASQNSATVAGGYGNAASGNSATVAGGTSNTASGSHSTVAGGSSNIASGDYSFAAGRRAKANHSGAFVWADSTDEDFASTANDQFLIRAAGGVGIGTTTPLVKLHVQANDLQVGTSLESDEIVVEAADPVLGLYGNPLGTFSASIALKEVSSGSLVDNWGIVRETKSAGAGLRFTYGTNSDQSSNTSVMYLDDSGNVGIGTTNPINKLSVDGGADFSGNVGIGTVSPWSKLAVDGDVSFIGNVGIGTPSPSTTLEVSDTEPSLRVAGGTNDKSSLQLYEALEYGFELQYDGSADKLHLWSKKFTGNEAIRMTWLKTGNVGIGTTTPGEKLHVVGNICATGTIGACSDARFKRNIKTADNSLAKVLKLRGVQFDWKRDGFPNHDFNSERQMGFVAQEIKAVLPEAVSQGSDGYYSVDYGRVTPVLVEAVKELNNVVEEKDAEIAAIKQHNERLEVRLARMEAMLAKLAASQQGGV